MLQLFSLMLHLLKNLISVDLEMIFLKKCVLKELCETIYCW